jgi:hypothetical protein
VPRRQSEAHQSRQKRTDWDGAWKEAIQQLFPAFLKLLFTDVHALIDWKQEPIFLEQELRQVTRRAKRGKGAVDKLARVRLLDGIQATLLIHIEFQNQVELDLTERLYAYNIGIYSLLRERVMTTAVLGDNDPRWRPAEFGYTIGSFETRMRFPVAKLLDYESHWTMLENSDNPFAVIVMAHLKALPTMGQPESRLEWKVRLATSLYERGYSEMQIQQLVDFIDWLMVLDDRSDAHFDQIMLKYEEEHTMETLSPYQKRFIAKGKREAIMDLLEARFGQVPEEIIDSINRIVRPREFKRLLLAASQVTTLREFFSVLPS